MKKTIRRVLGEGYIWGTLDGALWLLKEETNLGCGHRVEIKTHGLEGRKKVKLVAEYKKAGR